MTSSNKSDEPALTADTCPRVPKADELDCNGQRGNPQARKEVEIGPEYAYVQLTPADGATWSYSIEFFEDPNREPTKYRFAETPETYPELRVTPGLALELNCDGGTATCWILSIDPGTQCTIAGNPALFVCDGSNWHSLKDVPFTTSDREQQEIARNLSPNALRGVFKGGGELDAEELRRRGGTRLAMGVE